MSSQHRNIKWGSTRRGYPRDRNTISGDETQWIKGRIERDEVIKVDRDQTHRTLKVRTRHGVFNPIVVDSSGKKWHDFSLETLFCCQEMNIEKSRNKETREPAYMQFREKLEEVLSERLLDFTNILPLMK